MNRYRDCRLCPRLCDVDRTAGETGFCGETAEIRLAVATLHRGEEPPLTGEAGSGALFFSGCPLGCRDCQNCQLSRGELGGRISATELAEIMLACQSAGAVNINLVTGTHFAPSIVEAVAQARSAGLTIPTVWNSSGFELPATLSLLDPSIDIYLTDIKTLSPSLSRRLTGREDYPELAREAAMLMLEGRDLHYRGDILQRGVIVRHLVVPGAVEESLAVIDWFGREIGDRALFSLMTQFIDPASAAVPAIDERDFERLLKALDAAGIEEGFMQEPTEESDWLPDFRRANPFPAGFSRVVWHWREGFVSR